MKHMKTILLSSFSVLAFASTALAQTSSIGVNAAVKGNVTIASAEQTAKQALVKDPVFLGDKVNAEKLSSLQVLLLDETVFTVGPECELTIDTFVYDPNENTNSMQATVTKGMFRFMSGNIAKSGTDNVKINTPVASMGIRGTMVEGLVGPDAIALARSLGVINPDTKTDPEGASLFVLRGPGQRTQSKNRKGEIIITSAGKSVALNQSGMAVFVPDKDSAPFPPFMLPDMAFQVFNERLRTEPEGQSTQTPFELEPFLRLSDPVPEQKEDVLDDFIPSRDLDRPEVDSPAGPVPGNCTPADPDYPNCL